MNFTVHVAIVDEPEQVVCIDFFWQYLDTEADVFVAIKRGAQIKVAEVTTHLARSWRGYGTVDDHLCGS